MVNSDGWLKFIGNRNISSLEDAQNYIQKIIGDPKVIYHVFQLKSTQEALGIISFLQRKSEAYPDLGFAMLPKFHKNGYAFEACNKYLDALKEINAIHKVIAFCNPKNISSIKLLQNLGMKHQGDIQKGDHYSSYFSITLNSNP